MPGTFWYLGKSEVGFGVERPLGAAEVTPMDNRATQPPMSLSCGIVGLPNVGKSTLFNALTSSTAEAANYPFCTIDPNVGMVPVPDDRLDQICALIKPNKEVPTTVEFVDIAGLVAGASKGEGLGNQFLGHIRQVDAIAHIVRCFDDENITHVAGKVDPIADIETIDTELCLADLDLVGKTVLRLGKIARSGDKTAKTELVVAEKFKAALEDVTPLRSLELDEEETKLAKLWQFLTSKPVFYVCNVDEDHIQPDTSNEQLEAVKAFADKQNALTLRVCAKIEAELAILDADDKKELLESLELEEPGLNGVIRMAYRLLGLITYFTAGEKECRAWTIRKGTKAPQAAGVIHSDFERGFIRAETFHCNDLFEHKSETALKNAGLLRSEGKEYTVVDGDIMNFRFNV